ncbi:MAG TPA: TetR/AcrR family transcriptional regulator [Anaerolineae bacterium]|nr:TetR/AcrR family transcriptional regulator [Anaerolineae bacterium]
MKGVLTLATRARREREKEERRQSILRAAREALLEEGFYRITMDGIAERAEVSKGTVYLYFESKETLLARLLLEGLATLCDYLEEAYAPDRSMPANERLRRLSWAYLQFFQWEPSYFRFLMAVDRGRFREAVTPEVYQEVLEASMEGLNWVVRAIEQGVEDGMFDCCDVRQAAATFWAALSGVLDLMSHPLRQDLVGVSLETLYRTAVETVLRGLRAVPSRE